MLLAEQPYRTEPRWVSVRRLSAVSNPPEGRIVIVLKAYFDAGNEIDSTQYDIVTLAGMSARERDWPEFESAWQNAVAASWAECDMPPIQPYLHTTDMIAGNEPFTRKRGWTAARMDKLFEACALMVAEACDSKRFRLVSASVLLKDYKQVKSEGVRLANVEDICASFCVASAVAWSPEFAEEFMNNGAELYFDRNEPFRGSIVNRQQHRKLRNDPAWTKLILVGSVDSKLTPALQPADLLAWSLNAYHVDNVKGGWQLAMLSIEREKYNLGKRGLRQPNMDHLGPLLDLNLPTRRFR
jgi:hypothetical protein